MGGPQGPPILCTIVTAAVFDIGPVAAEAQAAVNSRSACRSACSSTSASTTFMPFGREALRQRLRAGDRA